MTTRRTDKTNVKGARTRTHTGGGSRRLPAAERRTALVAAARRVFLAVGLTGARTRDIALEAGVNEALIYQHFSSKQELFEAAVVDPLKNVVEAIRVAGEQALPRYGASGAVQYELTRTYIEQLVSMFIEVGPALGVVLFSDRTRGKDFYQGTLRPALEGIAGVVDTALPTFTKTDTDSERVTLTVLGACLMLSVDHNLGGRPVDVPAAAEELTHLVFYGVADRPVGDE